MRKNPFGKSLPALLAPLLLLASARPAAAHCPLCIGAVGAAATTASYYGLDPSIVGLLIGALALSSGLWIAGKVRRQYFRFQIPAVVVASFLLTIPPVFFLNTETLYLPLLLLGEPGSLLNRIYWVDKTLLGSLVGGGMTLLAFWTHLSIKKARSRVLFPFQGIAITLGLLLAAGLGLFFTIGG